MRYLAALLLSLSLVTAPAKAGSDVVVELYTSQGCSSCPPADAFLGKLAQRDDVIPLALHVDYWDYIGWKDIFADPAHTKRQRAYASAAGTSTIYTPQMIINGQDVFIGSRPGEVMASIGAHGARQPSVDIALKHADGKLSIRLTSRGMSEEPCVIQLVRYLPRKTVAIKRGENAGRQLTYHNIVTSWARLDEWDGAGTWTATVPIEGDAPMAVIVQARNHGAVLGAKRLR